MLVPQNCLVVVLAEMSLHVLNYWTYMECFCDKCSFSVHLVFPPFFSAGSKVDQSLWRNNMEI